MTAIFVNLTPHALNIFASGANNVQIPASGNVARVAIGAVRLIAEPGGVPVYEQAFGEVIGLPEPQAGTYFIVSRMVKDRVPERRDVLVPGAPIRDADGKIIGANGLSL